MENLTCWYCGKPATFVPHSRDVYHGRDYGPIYRCVPCEAHVGCHPGTERPLGQVANVELRKLKMAAHAAFDPLWKSKRMTRSEAYKWLAEQLGIGRAECHIGMFHEGQCRQVVRAVAALSEAR